jgi:ribosomal protein S18 acetylase RimI-like enzyme
VATLDAQAHDNLCDFTRFMARLEPGTPVLDADGVIAVFGRADWPSARIAVRTDDAAPAGQVVDAVERFLLTDGKCACVFLRIGPDDDIAPLLSARGFNEYANSPEMVCEARLEDREPPEDITVRLAETAADVRAYAEIAAHAFRHLGFPEDPTRATLDNPDVMLDANVAVSLAELDGRPVAGACSVIVGDVPNGYIGWVACHDDARGRGLGDHVTRLATNAAFDRGAQMVSLEASHFGEHTYARMGYREIYRYRMLIKV